MSLSISMVLLRDDQALSADEIQKDFAAKWSDLPSPSDVEQGDGTVSFNVGENSVIIAKMPAPFPWSDLEGPCATSVLWPSAEDDLKNHQRHAVVTVTGDLDPLAMSVLLTQATVSVMAATPSALGVYWGNATLIVPKDIFIDFATEVMPLGPPLHIWVDFRVGPDSERTSAGFTHGMQALGHMEFEAKQAAEPPGELRERFLALGSYVVENGPVIRDGDTVGEDEHERIRVVYSDSEFGHEEQVMRLVYEQESPKKPWWKLW